MCYLYNYKENLSHLYLLQQTWKPRKNKKKSKKPDVVLFSLLKGSIAIWGDVFLFVVFVCILKKYSHILIYNFVSWFFS